MGERSVGIGYSRIRKKLGIGKVEKMMETQEEFSPADIFSVLLPAGRLYQRNLSEAQTDCVQGSTLLPSKNVPLCFINGTSQAPESLNLII